MNTWCDCIYQLTFQACLWNKIGTKYKHVLHSRTLHILIVCLVLISFKKCIVPYVRDARFWTSREIIRSHLNLIKPHHVVTHTIHSPNARRRPYAKSGSNCSIVQWTAYRDIEILNIGYFKLLRKNTKDFKSWNS